MCIKCYPRLDLRDIIIPNVNQGQHFQLVWNCLLKGSLFLEKFQFWAETVVPDKPVLTSQANT